MGLAETQRLLAHLYTDSALRERFFADPNDVGEEWGLAPTDSAALAQTPPAQIAYFARSLQSKRLGEVRKLLPLTCRALGVEAGDLFRRYADAPIPAGIQKHRADALGFAAFLLSVPADERSAPRWLCDVLRYEMGWLRTGEPAFRFSACGTRHAILPLVRSLAAGETPNVLRSPTLLLWWRFTRSGPPRHTAVSLPVAVGKTRPPSPQ